MLNTITVPEEVYTLGLELQLFLFKSLSGGPHIQAWHIWPIDSLIQTLP